MGFLSNLFVIEHRYAASKIRDFATSLDIDEQERHAIHALGIGTAHYISERNPLLIGICLSAIRHFASTTKKEEVELASINLEKILEEYFLTRPGMDANAGLQLVAKAQNTYYIEEPEQIAAKFLGALTSGDLGAADVDENKPILELSQYLLRKSLRHVQVCITKLK